MVRFRTRSILQAPKHTADRIVWIHAEMQSETHGVQSFGAKSGASAFERAMNRLTDLNSLGDIAV